MCSILNWKLSVIFNMILWSLTPIINFSVFNFQSLFQFIKNYTEQQCNHQSHILCIHMVMVHIWLFLVQCILFPRLKVTIKNLMFLTYLSTFTVGDLFPGTACIFGHWFYNDHINWRCTAVRPWAPKYGKNEQLGVSILRTIG